MQFVNRELVKSGIARALRTVFESNQDFQYRTHPQDPNQPAEDSGIFIYDSYPWKKISYPCIIITLGPGDPLMRTMGGEHKFDNETPFLGSQDGLTYSNIDSETFGGSVHTTVKIEVYDRSAIDRARIMDWLDIYVRHFFVDIFRQQGVTLVDMTHGGERIEVIGNDPVYVDGLDMTVHSEFERTVSTELAGTIRAMSLTNLFTYLPNGSTDTQINS